MKIEEKNWFYIVMQTYLENFLKKIIKITLRIHTNHNKNVLITLSNNNKILIPF